MKSASNTLPDQPLNDVTAGIDWARDDHPHAVRILARAWVCAIWHGWQEGTAYDPARHNALQHLLREAETQAA